MAGFFGKVPMRGDFVRHSLPESFVKPWDRWLQAAIAGSRDILRDDWLAAYLTSPVWRFALSAHMTGELAAAGVIIPSVDGVGRYFPFTLACVLQAASTPVEIRAHTRWFDDAESLALKVLADDASLEELVLEVEELGRPELAQALPSDPEGMRFGEADESAYREVERFAPPHGLLWTSGSKLVQPSLLLVRQLPSARRFTALLDGAWAVHGWPDVAS